MSVYSTVNDYILFIIHFDTGLKFLITVSESTPKDYCISGMSTLGSLPFILFHAPISCEFYQLRLNDRISSL